MYGKVATRGRSVPADSPFRRAGQVWDDRLGSQAAQIRAWRGIAAGALGLVGVLSGGLLWQVQQRTVVPYIVEIDNAGRPGRIQLASEVYQPTAAQIGHTLADWIAWVRAKPLDPVVLRRNWLRAYEYVTPAGAQTLNGYAAAEQPFERIGQEARSVEVTSVVSRSADSWQVHWRETSYTNGAVTGHAQYTGLFTLRIEPPRDEAALLANPLGIRIDSLTWSKEL